jgi:hypothetical protein
MPAPHPPAFVPPPPSVPTDKAPICARPDEMAAFQAIGLQTELMQTALSCHGDDAYGTFVTTYKTELIDSRNVLAGFFKRAYGARFQTHYDEYITQLANAQSEHNLKSGALYCGFGDKNLKKSAALKTPEELSKYAAAVPIQQSLDVEACGSPSAPPETVPPATTKHRIKKHRRASSS